MFIVLSITVIVSVFVLLFTLASFVLFSRRLNLKADLTEFQIILLINFIIFQWIGLGFLWKYIWS